MPDERTILPRHLSVELQDALTYARVVNIVGARQAGKTTLVRDILKTGRFITLDDETVLEAIEGDPWGQLQRLKEEAPDVPLIIDEAQRSRKLALAIKRIVDSSHRKGQFVLTGSSNIFSTRHVADSLAGRMLTLTLWPLTAAETMSCGPSMVLDWAVSKDPDLKDLPAPESATRADYIGRVLKGGFPEIRDLDHTRRQRVYREYVDAMVDRDVADIVRIRKGDALRRLIDQLAVRTATELNIAELCERIGVQRGTVEQYLDVLTRLSLVVRLGAWTSGETRREIKNAKHHFVDAGIAARSAAWPRGPSIPTPIPRRWAGCWRASSSPSSCAAPPTRRTVFASITGVISVDARSTFWQRAPTTWLPSKSRPPHR